MICEYCEYEHPEDQIANPHYCVARLQEDLENARASNDDYYKEFKRMVAAERKSREASNAARDMLADENKAIKADIAALRKQVEELTAANERMRKTLEIIVLTHDGYCEQHINVSHHSYVLANIAQAALKGGSDER